MIGREVKRDIGKEMKRNEGNGNYGKGKKKE